MDPQLYFPPIVFPPTSPCAKFFHFYPSPTAMPGVIWSVEMHNVSKIALVVRRELLTITLSTEATSENVTIVQFYSYTHDKC